jgi:hypothetical protein
MHYLPLSPAFFAILVVRGFARLAVMTVEISVL